MKTKYLIISIGAIATAASPAGAESTASRKVSLSGNYMSEWQWDLNNHVNWANLLRLDFTFSPWKNGEIALSTIHIAGTADPIIADLQGFSNIEEENNFAAIAKAGIGQRWGSVDIFAGVRNVNEDYFISPVTSFFHNSSPGIFPTISACYPIANYPLSGLCLHWSATMGRWKIQSSLYDGRGYNGWNRDDNPFIVNFNRDGVFDISELSYQYARGRYFVGVAIHNRRWPVDDSSIGVDEIPESSTSCAWYAYVEQTLWDKGDRRLDLSLQYSENTNRRNACRRYAEVGSILQYAPDNTIGLSGQYARYVHDTEWSGEVTYSHDFTSYLSVQPSLQVIKNGNGCFVAFAARISIDFNIL